MVQLTDEINAQGVDNQRVSISLMLLLSFMLPLLAKDSLLSGDAVLRVIG